MYIHLMRFNRRKKLLSSDKNKTLALINKVYGNNLDEVLERERYVLFLRYIEEKELKDISKELKLNKSVISLIELKGIIKLQQQYE